MSIDYRNPLRLTRGEAFEAVILKWDAERGFGFVGRAGQHRGCFLHVSGLRTAATPRIGDRVVAVAEQDRDGRWRAVDVVLVEAAPPAPSGASGASVFAGGRVAPVDQASAAFCRDKSGVTP